MTDLGMSYFSCERGQSLCSHATSHSSGMVFIQANLINRVLPGRTVDMKDVLPDRTSNVWYMEGPNAAVLRAHLNAANILLSHNFIFFIRQRTRHVFPYFLSVLASGHIFLMIEHPGKYLNNRIAIRCRKGPRTSIAPAIT